MAKRRKKVVVALHRHEDYPFSVVGVFKVRGWQKKAKANIGGWMYKEGELRFIEREIL